MYSVAVNLMGSPSCDPENFVTKAAVFFNGNILEDEMAVKRMVDDLHRLTRVCNHNKRGAKINFEYSSEDDTIHIFTGEGKVWSIFIFMSPIAHQLSMLDIDTFVEMSVHNSSLTIFDQYLAEKNLEMEVGYEGL